MRPSIRPWLAVAGLLIGSSLMPRPALSAEARRPNILIIVSDDHGYADVGFHGCQDIPTPNIDSLARSGVRFTNGYVSGPYCSPTRAGLLTGRYQQRFGHEFNPGSGSWAAPILISPTRVRVRQSTVAPRSSRKSPT